MKMHTEFYQDEVRVTKPCMICGKESTVAFPKEYYRRGIHMMCNGALVQEAFPISSAEVREFIITGMCLDCQDEFFSDPDEEDDYEDDYVNVDTEYQFLHR